MEMRLRPKVEQSTTPSGWRAWGFDSCGGSAATKAPPSTSSMGVSSDVDPLLSSTYGYSSSESSESWPRLAKDGAVKQAPSNDSRRRWEPPGPAEASSWPGALVVAPDELELPPTVLGLAVPLETRSGDGGGNPNAGASEADDGAPHAPPVDRGVNADEPLRLQPVPRLSRFSPQRASTFSHTSASSMSTDDAQE